MYEPYHSHYAITRPNTCGCGICKPEVLVIVDDPVVASETVEELRAVYGRAYLWVTPLRVAVGAEVRS